jgi:transposase
MPKTPNRRLTYKERVQIWTLREAGWKQKDIATHLGIPQTTVSLCLRTPTTPAPPRGRPSKISTPLRILLVRHATQNAEQRRKTREEIAQELGISACRRTLVKAFEKELYHRRKATEKPLLTKEQMNERLRWAWEHVSWSDEDWDSCSWGDEMSISLSHGEVYVTRKKEEKYLPSCCIPKFKGYSAGHVWGIISTRWKGPLVFFKKEWLSDKGTVNSDVYIRTILPHIQAFQEYVQQLEGEQQLLYFEDNSSIHSSRATSSAMQALGINKALGWPPNSPDLNPIENVWRLLKWRVSRRFPHTEEDLRRIVMEEWEKVECSDYKKYIREMRDRCWAVIQADGGHTKW